MKKLLKDTKLLLFENMVKLNPDFKLTEADDKWIQKAVNPEHKGYCTPMTKSTCTPARKALAKRFKKGIDEELGVPEIGEVKVQQNDFAITAPLVLDDTIADGSVYLASGLRETVGLGRGYQTIHIEQANHHE